MIRFKTISRRKVFIKRKMIKRGLREERGGEGEVERVKWVMVTTTNQIYSDKVSIDKIELVIKVLGKFRLG